MVEHYAAGEGQGEEAPKVTICIQAACLLPFSDDISLNVSRQNVFISRMFVMVHAPPALWPALLCSMFW